MGQDDFSTVVPDPVEETTESDIQDLLNDFLPESDYYDS